MIGPRFSLLLPAIGFLVLPLTLAGCGKKEPANVVHVSGTATYKGQPIPLGMIVFEPDPAQGNKGTQGHAEIKNGKFDTRLSEKGAVVGPSIVRITGGDGAAPEPFSPLGKMLFAEYTTRVNLSRDKTALSFDVPVAVSRR